MLALFWTVWVQCLGLAEMAMFTVKHKRHRCSAVLSSSLRAAEWLFLSLEWLVGRVELGQSSMSCSVELQAALYIEISLQNMKKKEGAAASSRSRPAGPGGLSLLPPPPGGKGPAMIPPLGEQPPSFPTHSQLPGPANPGLFAAEMLASLWVCRAVWIPVPPSAMVAGLSRCPLAFSHVALESMRITPQGRYSF